MSTAAASQDITLFHPILHKNLYDFAKAVLVLVCQGGLLLCWGKMEEWSVSEASILSKEALEKYRKDFSNIHQNFLPWKLLISIIQY